MIKFTDVNKWFGTNHVLQNINLDVAQGEVVVVNDKFGIRLTDIITPSERMRKIGH